MSDVEGPGASGPIPTSITESPPTGAPNPHGPPTPPFGQVAVRVPSPPAEPRDLNWQFFATVVVGAVGTDLALRNPPWNNVAVAGAAVALALALVLSGRLVSTSSRVAIGLAALLGFFVWFRTDPVLVVFNIMGVLALGWYAVVHARGQSMWDTGPVRVLVRAADTFVLSLETLIDSAVEIGARQRHARTSGRLANEVGAGLVRGAVIAIPILVILGLLLASADAVFASFFDVGVGVNVPSLIGHVVLLGIGALATVLLLRVAGRDLTTSHDRWDGLRLGRIETMVVLVGLNLLFAAFAAAQLVALTGGADRVLESAGLTFKEYARQGFFQLLWVAGIALVVLVSLNTLTRSLEKGRRTVVWASLVGVALTLLIVVVAFGRLRLYIADDGLTPLRFYSSVFSIWIGVVFLLLAARLLGRWADRAWLTTAIGLSGVLFLVGLNVASPEAVIADNNLHRDEYSILYHMEKLTADGQVALFDGLDRLSPELREDVRDKLCDRAGRGEFDRSGLNYNLSEARLAQREAANC